MIWTLVVFAIALYVLRKLAFPRIAEALDKRQKAIEDAIDTADRTRKEADELLARVPRAAVGGAHAGRRDRRPRAQDRRAHGGQGGRRGQAQEGGADGADPARDPAGDRARGPEIRAEVADLTVLATEKVTRKTLDDADQRKLVEDALSELDFSSLAQGRGQA